MTASASTYGSRGIARYRVACLERAGVRDDASEMRAARARLAYLRGEPEPVGDDAAVAAYRDEHERRVARQLVQLILAGQPVEVVDQGAIYSVTIKGVVSF